MKLPLPRLILAFAVLAFCSLESIAADAQLKAQLIWGTIEAHKESKHPAVDPALAEKLKKILKWKHYYEVKAINVDAPSDKAKRHEISDKCHIDLQTFGKNDIEVKIYGEGKLLRTVRQPIPPGEILTLAGDDKNDTAWFVVLTNTGK